MILVWSNKDRNVNRDRDGHCSLAKWLSGRGGSCCQHYFRLYPQCHNARCVQVSWLLCYNGCCPAPLLIRLHPTNADDTKMTFPLDNQCCVHCDITFESQHTVFYGCFILIFKQAAFIWINTVAVFIFVILQCIYCGCIPWSPQKFHSQQNINAPLSWNWCRDIWCKIWNRLCWTESRFHDFIVFIATGSIISRPWSRWMVAWRVLHDTKVHSL